MQIATASTTVGTTLRRKLVVNANKQREELGVLQQGMAHWVGLLFWSKKSLHYAKNRSQRSLALHELRASFAPLLWKQAGHSDLEQVWFPGAHADVGGGYRAGETCLSDTSLMWMAAEAEAKGLALDRASHHLNHAPCAPHVHHELRGMFLPTMPMVRKWLRLHTWDSADTFHFHGSARDYLFATPRPEYKFKHPLVNAALRQAGALATPRMVLSRLKGNRVVS